MRISSIISNLGIQNALTSAKLIDCGNAKRPVAAYLHALYGEASLHSQKQMRDKLRQWPNLTRGATPCVTGGACFAVAKQRSERLMATAIRRSAAQ